MTSRGCAAGSPASSPSPRRLAAAARGRPRRLSGQTLIRWWVGDELVPPVSLLVAFALWTVYSLALTQCSYLLNAAAVVGPQIVMAVAMAVVNIPLSIVLTHELGIVGPLYGSLIAHVVCAGVPTVVLVRRVLAGAGTATPAGASR